MPPKAPSVRLESREQSKKANPPACGQQEASTRPSKASRHVNLSALYDTPWNERVPPEVWTQILQHAVPPSICGRVHAPMRIPGAPRELELELELHVEQGVRDVVNMMHVSKGMREETQDAVVNVTALHIDLVREMCCLPETKAYLPWPKDNILKVFRQLRRLECFNLLKISWGDGWWENEDFVTTTRIMTRVNLEKKTTLRFEVVATPHTHFTARNEERWIKGDSEKVEKANEFFLKLATEKVGAAIAAHANDGEISFGLVDKTQAATCDSDENQSNGPVEVWKDSNGRELMRARYWADWNDETLL